MKLEFMEIAVAAARQAETLGEVPIGAVLISPAGNILAVSGNRIIQDNDPTAHAEIIVVREAAKKLQTPRLVGCALYVTLEPCPMCAQAISFARIKTLYFGAWDIKGGGVDHGPQIFNQPTCHHKTQFFGGILADESQHLLESFFQERR